MASVTAALAIMIFAVFRGAPVDLFVFVTAFFFWPLCLAGGLVFVLPVLAWNARVRQPPIWIAICWGALASYLTILGLGAVYTGGVGGEFGPPLSFDSMAVGGFPGAIAGLTYSLVARWLSRRRRVVQTSVV